MTVPVPGSLVYTYSADDSTTSFSYPVRFLDKAEIVVILREGVTDTVQVLGSDYTISGSSWPTGGSIVFGTAPASGKTVVIYRNTVAKQLVDLENTQRNDANAVEAQLDRLAMVQQDHGRKFEGTWQTRPGEVPGTIDVIPDGHILVSDEDGNLIDGGIKGSAANSEVGQFATAAQGAAADSAVQPGDLGPVATSNDYGDLDNLPSLGTASGSDVGDFATSAQGSKADTAVQPGDAEALPTDGTVGQILVRDPDAAAGRKWTSIAAGVGDMLSTAYDPAGKGEQVLTVTDAPSNPDLSNDTDKLALRGDVAEWVGDPTEWASTSAIVRKVGEKLNLDLPSSADLGHSPDATASYNDGALQAAIDGMVATDGGGVLNIPRGQFEHSAQINCPKVAGGKHVLLRGSGRGTKLHFTPTEAMNAFYVGSDSLTGGEAGFKFFDMELAADISSHPVIGVYLQNANSFHAERVNMRYMTDGFVADHSYALRLIANRLVYLDGDFFRAATRSHGNVFRDNGFYTSDGYFINSEDTLDSTNNFLSGNDLEVIGGIIKVAGNYYSLMMIGTYMEQSTVKVFDFGNGGDLEVTGAIIGNELSLSPSQAFDNFKGEYRANHSYNFPMTAGANSKVDYGRHNILKGTSTLPTQAAGTAAWTPVLSGSTSAGVGTYTSQYGQVMYSEGWAFIIGVIGVTAHTGTGNIVISGLPMAAVGQTVPIMIRVNNMDYSNDLVAAVGGSNITVQSQSSGAALAQVPIDGSCTISFSGMYRIE